MPFKRLLDTIKDRFLQKEEVEDVAQALPPSIPVQPQAPALCSAQAPEPPKKYLFATFEGAAGRPVAPRQSAPLHPSLSRIQNQDNAMAAQKAENVARIESMFGEFGIAVCSYMLTQSMTPGGVGRVLKKLSIPSRGRESADMAQVENWVLKEGAEAFCTLVGIRHEGNAHFPPNAPPLHGEEHSSGHPSQNPLRPLLSAAKGTREVGIGCGAEKILRPTPKEEGQQDKSHINNVNVQPIGLQGKNLVSRREMKYGAQEAAPQPEAYIPLPPEAPPEDDGTDAPTSALSRPTPSPTPAPPDKVRPIQLVQDPLKPMVKLSGGEGKLLRASTAEPEPYPSQPSGGRKEPRPQEPKRANPPPKKPSEGDETPASFYPRRRR